MTDFTCRWLRLLVLVGLVAAPGLSPAQQQPAVAIIIDDIGYRPVQDGQALALPGQLSYAVLPDAPRATAIANAIHATQRDVLVHLPMESVAASQKRTVSTLTRDMRWETFIIAVARALARVPHAIGVNNHQGSLLTADAKRMDWLMQELLLHPGMAFIDSRTTRHSVAYDKARQNGLRTATRDVFLDYEPGMIADQFAYLIQRAKKKGTALAIAHPKPESLKFLSRNLSQLEQQGIRLVSISELIRIQQQSNEEEKTWQASLSQSPKVAKNSKPSPSSTCCAEPESMSQ